jgi:periplasmic divalent cation tolerance protein
VTARPVMIWCPFADDGSGAQAADTLLDEHLVACANILAPMRSLYRWDGERGEDTETGVLFKTDSERRDAVMARLAEIHPYGEPAILAWECDAAPGTVAWLAKMGA